MSSESTSVLALTPEALINQIKIQLPEGPVTIQGHAQKIRFWPPTGKAEKCYGRLELGSACVSFQVPAECAPLEGAPIILHGTLSLIPPKKREADHWRATHEIRLTGTVVGQWVPVTVEAQPAKPLQSIRQDRPRISLASFMRNEENVTALGLLYTETAWEDFLQSAVKVRSAASLKRKRTSFADEDRFLADLRTLVKSSSVKAIAILRGGGSDMEHIGNSTKAIQALAEIDLPFYAALGHSHHVLLIDKYADQTFHTPSALGTEFQRAYFEGREVRQLKEDKQRLTQKVEELHAALGHSIGTSLFPRLNRATIPWRIVAILLVIVYFVARYTR